MSNIFDILDEEYEEDMLEGSEEEKLSEAINFLESDDEGFDEACGSKKEACGVNKEACGAKKEACGAKKEGCKSEMTDEEIEQEASHYLEAAENLDKIVVEDPYSGEF